VLSPSHGAAAPPADRSGPTQAKSYWAGDDILLVVLGDGLTDVERTLSEKGRGRLALA
jgi:hypothetical protein